MSERVEGKPIASPENTLTVALSLAKAGWPVFPVKLVPVTRADGTTATDKRPLVRWLEGASTDLEQIATWWGSEFPGAWVGVHAERAGIVIVDLDKSKPWPDSTPNVELRGKPKGDGRDNLRHAGIELPNSLKYKTRSGGHHIVYAAPEGRRLTIGRDVPVPGVDIRAGNGLMVYYGPPLVGPPQLAPAPEWSLIERASTGTGDSRTADGDLAHFLRRAVEGEPVKPLRKIVRKTDWAELKHDDMLQTVAELVKGAGLPGGRTAWLESKAAYIEGRPDRERDWDNATKGSIGRLGVPPLTLALSKDERKLIAERSKPKAVKAREEAAKVEYRVKKHKQAHEAPEAGVRILEDGPLAVELAAAMRGRWAWTEAMGLLRYTGRRWEPAEPFALVEEVRDRLDDIEVQEHETAVRRGDNKAIDKARTLLSRNRAKSVAELIIGRLALERAKPDDHPHLLNTPTGVIDLRTKKLLPHDPSLMLTKMTAVGYDPEASLKRVHKALTALPPKVAPWVQVRMGQAATGRTPDDDVLVLFEGAGENGKTTLLIGAREALGDYAVTVPERLLMANPGDHPTELTTLMGARLAVVEELSEGRNLNVKRLKDVVGTPVITARRMRQDNISWRATHSTLLSTNYTPIVAETDHGTWRRLALLRFPYRFVKTTADIESDRDRVGDPRLKRHFEQNADAGLLRWLVEGAHAWYAAGERMPPMPKKVRRDTLAWRMDADPVLSYVDERLERDDDRAIACVDLAADFNDYIERKGHRPWSSQTINARFEGHVGMSGIERKRVKFGRVTPSRPGFMVKALPPNTQAWVGLRFKDDTVTVPSEAERDAAAFDDLAKRAKR